jgi:hypothetical protein
MYMSLLFELGIELVTGAEPGQIGCDVESSGCLRTFGRTFASPATSTCT